jgi:hypothetical protein
MPPAVERREAHENFRETLKVTERRDDTTKPSDESRPAPGGGSYYYDDATGYEPYTPEEEEGEEDEGEGTHAPPATQGEG